MPPTQLRPLTVDDEPILRELIWLAVYWARASPPARPARLPPEIEGYVAGFGQGADRGLLAYSSAGPLGACWIRERNAGYGYVAEGIGELSLAVFPEWRGKGIGRALLSEVLGAESGPISLSVDPANPARRLYEQFEFQRVGASGTSWTMLRRAPG